MRTINSTGCIPCRSSLNSAFIFLKTANSFHGVEPVIDPDCKRMWLLLFDVYFRQGEAASQPISEVRGQRLEKEPSPDL